MIMSFDVKKGKIFCLRILTNSLRKQTVFLLSAPPPPSQAPCEGNSEGKIQESKSSKIQKM